LKIDPPKKKECGGMGHQMNQEDERLAIVQIVIARWEIRSEFARAKITGFESMSRKISPSLIYVKIFLVIRFASSHSTPF